jgi:hypothetical protein
MPEPANVLRVVQQSDGAPMPSRKVIDNAKTGPLYKAAIDALAACAGVDEIAAWEDEQLRLAAYQRQAHSDADLSAPVRVIRARAARKVGEHLKSFDGRGRPPEKISPVAVANISQAAAGEAAGLSKRQILTARRIADIPDATFEAEMAKPLPPSLTKLAGLHRRGEAKQPIVVADARHRAVVLMRRLHGFAAFLDRQGMGAGGIGPYEVHDVRRSMRKIREWLRDFDAELPRK